VLCSGPSLLALIHPTLGKGHSASYFAITAFYEVRTGLPLVASCLWWQGLLGPSWGTQGFSESSRGKERAMDARDAAARQVGGDDGITTRMGAVALPIGVVLIAISEVFHPSRVHPMDFPAVFREYANSDVWTAVHLGEYFGFLFLLGGLVALYYSVRAMPGAGLAPFAFAAAVTTASSFSVLQAVDGTTLRYAVDA
jgi:hypothetical protein